MGNPYHHEFWSIDKIDYNIELFHLNQYLSIIFQLDQQKDVYNRVTYSLLDMTGQIGGVFEIFTLLCGFAVSAFNKRMLLYCLMQNIYYTQNNNCMTSIEPAWDNSVDNVLNKSSKSMT